MLRIEVPAKQAPVREDDEEDEQNIRHRFACEEIGARAEGEGKGRSEAGRASDGAAAEAV
jgi:hypothetical protein